MGIFDKYGVFSNLKLNLAKTILATLFSPGKLAEAKEALRQAAQPRRAWPSRTTGRTWAFSFDR
eukprot:10893292-Alexandrium_andersonii.AAC.1